MAYDDHVEEGYRAARQAEDAGVIAARARRVKIKIDRIRIKLDPTLDIFNVEITGGGGEWRHTTGSEADLQIFLEGMRAGIAMIGGQLEVPEIPHQPTSTIR